MVLDVTRWLPEHQGGSKIIPRQSLNMDCRWVLRAWNAGWGRLPLQSVLVGGDVHLVSSSAPALRPCPCARSRFFELNLSFPTATGVFPPS